jgi:hypothetical protein
MMSWYKVAMTSRDITARRDDHLEDTFKQVLTEARFPQDAALFSNDFPPGEDLIYFFSPGAVRIAESLISLYSGVPCEGPPKYSLFIHGHESFRNGFVKGE